MTKMRYFGNTSCPRDVDKWARYQIHHFMTMDNGAEAIRQENERRLAHVRTRLIGRPHATNSFTVEQLEDMGMVGEYSYEIDDYARQYPGMLIVDYNGPLFKWSHSAMAWVSYNNIPMPQNGKIVGISPSSTCPDCKGSGKYQGIRIVEDCRACKGNKQI